MHHALALLTFVPASSRSDVGRRLPAAIESLERTAYPGPVVIVDDGSDCPRHRDYLATLSRRYRVIQRLRNGGIGRAKNTCLRVLLETGIGVGFVAEDDIEYRSGWWQPYLAAHENSGIQHFSWAHDADPGGMRKRRQRVNGYPVVRTSRVNGVLLTFTPAVIERVGGFGAFPAKWGHEHTHWTRRIVAAGLAPFFCDICASNEFIGLNRFAGLSSVCDADKRRFEVQNRRMAADVRRLWRPLEE